MDVFLKLLSQKLVRKKSLFVKSDLKYRTLPDHNVWNMEYCKYDCSYLHFNHDDYLDIHNRPRRVTFFLLS